MTSTDPTESRALETKLRMIVSHATGGSFQDITASTNEICCRITANRNFIYEEGKKRGALSEPREIERDEVVRLFAGPWPTAENYVQFSLDLIRKARTLLGEREG